MLAKRVDTHGKALIRGILLSAHLICFAAAPATASELCDQSIGRIASLQGQVEIRRGDKGEWRPAALDQELCPADVIKVGELSRALLAVGDQPKLRIDQNTTVRLVHVNEAKGSWIDVLIGAVYAFSKKPRSLTVETPFVNAAIEGTEFLIEVTRDSTRVTVIEGTVAAENDKGRVLITRDESAFAQIGEAPVKSIVVRPLDAVHWALFYPPIFQSLTEPFEVSADELPPSFREAIQHAARGDAASAFDWFDSVDPADRNALYFTVRAAVFLWFGRVDEASKDITEAIAMDPREGLAYALRAVIGVTLNENQLALEDAQSAVKLAPGSAAARIALSYAQQSKFDLIGAKRTLEHLVSEAPSNALARARYAEILLALGDRHTAIEQARKARNLAPRLARIQTVLGFAWLTEFRTAEARFAFELAIAADPVDPMPHFGLGLARIRDGNLAQGVSHMEAAVALAPNDSLLRSYLGKAYFEQRRGAFAGRQLALAKQLDPRDPTPYLYDAILKQSENRPVEALEDLETSIRLNDDRAVYRSQQLLDSDRAARGASLARIYQDLGFEQAGIQVATQSLDYDPQNAAAHRFLSDLYVAQPRREIARVSELLQAQLLQQINVNPLQPSLSELNLNLYTSGGPTRLGLNEFTPLFEGNQAQLNTYGLAGSWGTLSGEGVVSGLYDGYSLSGGNFYYKTDGFRQNSHLQHNITNFYAQAALTPEFNVQTEFRRRRSENGDIRLRFDASEFSRNLDQDLSLDTERVGIRYSPTDQSTFLGSVILNQMSSRSRDTYNDAVTGADLLPPELLDLKDFIPEIANFANQSFDIDSAAKRSDVGVQFEGQYQFTSKHLNVTTGYGFYDIDSHSEFSSDIRGVGQLADESIHSTLRQNSAYGYFVVKWPDRWVWTLGASYDEYKEEEISQHNFNPKLGVAWSVAEGIRLRAAIVQTSKPALLANQTIQPTQVAGFNQFFDDFNGTTSRLYSIALDAQLESNFFVGWNAYWRSLDVYALTEDGQKRAIVSDVDEKNIGAYAYWAPFREWVVTADVVYDVFTDEQHQDTPSVFPQYVETFSVPIGIRYFSETGIFAGITTTFVHQDVQRKDYGVFDLTTADGSDNFTTVDVQIGYRFPRRFGNLTVEINNIFDKSFKYHDDSFREFGANSQTISPYLPGRSVIASISLNF